MDDGWRDDGWIDRQIREGETMIEGRKEGGRRTGRKNLTSNV